MDKAVLYRFPLHCQFADPGKNRKINYFFFSIFGSRKCSGGIGTL